MIGEHQKKKKKKKDEIDYLLCSVPISFTSYDTAFKLYNEMNPLLIQENCQQQHWHRRPMRCSSNIVHTLYATNNLNL